MLQVMQMIIRESASILLLVYNLHKHESVLGNVHFEIQTISRLSLLVFPRKKKLNFLPSYSNSVINV